MTRPAARITDMHVCPMATPAPVPVPHVGGPVTGPCAPTVLIGALPAARIGDACICVGPPDMIVQGSTTVIVAGMPQARIGDLTLHGGTIVMGHPTVLVGG
ncbi:PAAR domain-containing protein [Arenibaculum pallidiluteum]|uniref:PAAR domain-containing protein n=1 Tax=Arenibaculum pallidiluteum TaxID=2812559 RepID=UPI001A9702BA|nr:PAAR domain-containing protein [Arenibaculum pallidiluteum]